MTRHTTLILLAMLMITLGLALISLAAPIISWIVIFAIAAVLLLVSLTQRRTLSN